MFYESYRVSLYIQDTTIFHHFLQKTDLQSNIQAILLGSRRPVTDTRKRVIKAMQILL